GARRQSYAGSCRDRVGCDRRRSDGRSCVGHTRRGEGRGPWHRAHVRVRHRVGRARADAATSPGPTVRAALAVDRAVLRRAPCARRMGGRATDQSGGPPLDARPSRVRRCGRRAGLRVAVAPVVAGAREYVKRAALAVLLAGAALLTIARPAAADTVELPAQRVLIISLPKVDWADVQRADVPNLRSLLETSGVAGLSSPGVPYEPPRADA